MLEKCPRCNGLMFEYETERWMCENYKDLLARNKKDDELDEGECDFFFDKDGFEYMSNDLFNKSPKGFYSMSNEDLADAYFTVLSKTYPNVLYVKHGISQYFATTKNGKKQMLNLFSKNKTIIETDLVEVSSGLEKINSSNL